MREHLGIIAGSGAYPLELAAAAREQGVGRITVAAFTGETDPSIAGLAETVEWLRVGQLGKLLAAFQESGVREVVMAGQVAPRNLFDLRPDFKALLVLAKLKRRNAESIFGAIADELANVGITLLPATSHLEHRLARPGLIAGPQPRRRQIEDIRFGFGIAREVARLDIGQTVVVRHGTVLAVEGFEGTNAAIRRGAELGRGEAVVAKVSKPGQDFRFDVPVIGAATLSTCAEAGVRVLAVEAGRTLVLEAARVAALAKEYGITVWAEENE